MMSLTDRLKAARRAGVSLIGAASPDPAETIRLIRSAFENGAKTPIPMIQWDAITGLSSLNDAGHSVLAKMLDSDDEEEWAGMSTNPGAALTLLRKVPGEIREGGAVDGKLLQRGTIVFWHNAQRLIEDATGRNNGQVIQGVWNLRDLYKQDRRTLVLLGPSLKLPPELTQDVILFDEPLPSDEALRSIVTKQAEAADVKLDETTILGAIDALRGLSAFTAEQVTAMSLDTTKGVLDIEELWRSKISVICQTEGLSVDSGSETFDDICGLENFREFATGLVGGKRAPTVVVRVDEMEKFFGGLGSNGGPSDNTGTSQDMLGVMLREMEDSGHTGLIALGHAGCGKTLITKAIANMASKILGRRVLSISLDLGATKGGIVGESERKIRAAMKVIKSLAAGGRVLFVGTCNDIKILPPALKRRFKLGTWMFDLPEAAELASMVKLYMKKFDLKDKKLPDMTDWTGADVRNVCDVADQLGCSMEKATQYVTFVAKSDPDAISRLRKLADGKYISASQPGVYRNPTATETAKASAPATGRRVARGEEE